MTLNKYFKFTQPRPNPKFPRRTYYAFAPNDVFQVDLIDLTGIGKEEGVGSRGGVHKEQEITKQAGKGTGGYIMNVIDVYSRKADSVVIESKSGDAIMMGLKKIFERMGKPKKIQSDKEGGLLSKEKELNNMGIQIYQVANAYDNRYSAPIVERLNRTMKDYRHHYEVDHPEKSNLAISKFVASNFPKKYNSDIHRTIKTTPNNAFNGSTSMSDVLGAVFKYSESKPIPKRQINTDLRVGSLVYIPKEATGRQIEKKGAEKWIRTPYEIEEITSSNPPQYKLKGLKQKYYKEQLKKSTI